MEADDLGTYVVKWRAAGQGVRVLVAEVVCGELARALDLPVPALVTVDVAPGLGGGEPDGGGQGVLRGAEGRGAVAAPRVGGPQPRPGLPPGSARLRGRCRRRRPVAGGPGV